MCFFHYAYSPPSQEAKEHGVLSEFMEVNQMVAMRMESLRQQGAALALPAPPPSKVSWKLCAFVGSCVGSLCGQPVWAACVGSLCGQPVWLQCVLMRSDAIILANLQTAADAEQPAASGAAKDQSVAPSGDEGEQDEGIAASNTPRKKLRMVSARKFGIVSHC
jgi:hypothetical protein